MLKMNERKMKNKQNKGYQSVQLHVHCMVSVILWFIDLSADINTFIHHYLSVQPYDTKKTEPEENRKRNLKKYT